MKVSVTKELLLQGLQRVFPAVAPKHYIPVMTHFLVEGTKKGLRIYGTDGDLAVGTLVEADVEVTGALTVPARLLLGIVKEIPSGNVRLRLGGPTELIIEHGRASLRIKGFPSPDFPSFPEVKFGDAITVGAGDLQQMIARVSYATSQEESRPILNGVLWELSAKRMRMVATSGHRFAMVTRPAVGGLDRKGEPDLILAPKALRQVTHVFAEGEELEVAASGNHMGFRTARTQLVTRLIEGPYPNYEQVIPKDNDIVVVVDRDSLTAALRRVLMVTGEHHRIALTFNEKSVVIVTRDKDLGEARERITASLDGVSLQIGMNVRFLLDLLETMPTEDVRIRLKKADTAVTFEPEGWKEKGSMLALVMPMRVEDLADLLTREGAAA
jgi:DNA polymerase-3 subunit beta